MSKTLYLVRHAKSSWKNTALTDYERPLNKRGQRDAPEMGRRLATQNIQPDLIISSPAVRAKRTAQAIAASVEYPKKSIQWQEEVYHASSEVLLKIIKSIPKKYQSLMLVGHNPGLTYLQNTLCSEAIDNIVTTGIVGIRFDVNDWSKINSGQVQWYDYPKKGT